MELKQLRALCGVASAGHGAAIAVEGPAGVGKTALLGAARNAGEQAGMRVLSASGAELERELAFGVVRQLFERPLRGLSREGLSELLQGAPGLARAVVLDPDPSSTRPEAAQAAMHGLYWLAAELAAQRPLLVLVDDAHWADAPSLRWLAYLARRLEGVALLVVLGCRDAEPGADATLLEEVVSEAHAGELRPRPLSKAGVRRWLASSYEHEPSPEFVEAFFAATAGNPLLLGELAAELRAEALTTDSVAASRIAGIAPPTVARSVLMRLARFGPDAVAVAESVAILSADASLGRIAAVANVPIPRAGELVDILAASGILRHDEEIRFAHPLLRAGVYGQIPAARRGLGHAAAARRLLEDGCAPERAANHLLLAPSTGDQATVRALRAAAASAVGRGAPDAGAVLLRRALAEPPDARPEVLLELAAAEATARDPAALDHAREVVATSPVATHRAQAAFIAADALIDVGRGDEAAEILQDTARDEESLDDAVREQLLATGLVMSVFGGSMLALTDQLTERGADDLAGETAAERVLLVLRAVDLTIRARPRQQALELVERVLKYEDPANPGHAIVPTSAARALAAADHLDEARELYTKVIDGGRSRGAVVDVATGFAMRAEAERWAGRLVEAEADARLGYEMAVEHGIWLVGAALGQLAEVLLERESPEMVLALIDDSGIDPRRLPPHSISNVFLHARGRARALAGDIARATEDLATCGRQQTAWGELNPASIPWRSSLALAEQSLGDAAEARRLVDEELELAQSFGAARPVGIALRTRGLLERGDAAIKSLEEAVSTLAQSPARLEHARAMTDLGAALRRAGRRAEARDQLRAGLDMAHRCGALQLSARGRAELRAAGARPRRERLSGAEALTASERRVAELAAEGLTNRQIAQTLFVTTKTIEMHLGHVYPKLGIAGRRELSQALSQGSHR